VWGRGVSFITLRGFGALDLALIFFAVLTPYVEPFAIHSIVHDLPYFKFPCLKGTTVVNLIDQVGAV
jgi:hypothetical protein